MNAPVRGRTRLSPWQDLEAFQDRINRLLDLPSPALLAEPRREWTPLARIVEGDREYVLRADLTGTEREHVQVDGITVVYEDGVLTVRVPKRPRL
ncbi:MAG TPA: hypothetical protein VE173_14095 [Longimicrobiales bacterium]|jgi:HSP20 family molecular chaperone IbpA|nr:hypothetical protein [Longimicrobiales bacterium]